MFFPTSALCRSRAAELLSGVSISKELLKQVHTSTSLLSRSPCLVVVLVGDRPDSIRYVETKRRAGAECGISVRLVQLSATIQQEELHRVLAAVNKDVEVDGVILQLPLPPHLRARPALFHIHPCKDVDGLHPVNAGNLFLQDQSPLRHADFPGFSATRTLAANRQGHAVADATQPLASSGVRRTGVRRRHNEGAFFVPCTALAIRTILFSYINRTHTVAEERPSTHHTEYTAERDTCRLSSSLSSSIGTRGGPTPERNTKLPRRDLHAVIVNTSMVVGVPTAALLQRAGGFTVATCSRSNSLDSVRRLTREADVLITAYGVAKVFDRSFVRDGAIVIDAAINELPPEAVEGKAGEEAGGDARKRRLCGDVDVESVSVVAAAITKTPGGVGPLTVSYLMSNVLKAVKLREANYSHFNDSYTQLVKMYTTFEKVRDGAPHLASPCMATSPPIPDGAGVGCRKHSAATLPAVVPEVIDAALDAAVNISLTESADIEGEEGDLADDESYRV